MVSSKNFKAVSPLESSLLFIPIAFGNILKWLFTAYFLQTKFVFIGLILGSIPSLIKITNSEKIKLKNLIYLFLSFSISLLLIHLEKIIPHDSINYNSFAYLVFSGFLMSIGVVIPGVSSTVILMLMGIYSTYLSAVSSLDLVILFPIGIGLVLGGFVFLRIIEVLLKKLYIQTYYSIIGFVCGSVFILYEPLQFNNIGFICLLCFMFGFMISVIIEKK